MGKHTGGPWSHDGDGDIVGADESYVAYGHGGQRAIGSDADATLISAAPELLEALEFVNDCLVKCLTGGEIKALVAGKAIEQAALVIAKARGESQ